MLKPIAENIWLCDGPDVDFYGFAYPTRMVIVRLPDEKLWIWSPIVLTEEMKAIVDALGSVAHLVSPNPIHHLFLSEWKSTWPDAKLYGPASTIKKRADLTFEPPLDDETPPDSWQNAFRLFHFTGSPALDEIAFFHSPSQTIIFADLSEHFSEDYLHGHWSWWQRPIARIWGIVEGKGFAPLEWRLSWWKRKAARQKLEAIIALNPKFVIMAHGEWVSENAGNFLARAFSWLLK